MKLKNIMLFMGMLALVAVTSKQVNASVIFEVEPNDTLAAAQNIDPHFSIGPNPNVIFSDVVPWVSIVAPANNDTFDYYSFSVNNGGDVGIFDVDFGVGGVGSIDTTIALWDSLGNVLPFGFNDDSNAALGAAGSVSDLDPFLPYVFQNPGLYIVGVAGSPSTAVQGGWDLAGTTLPSLSTYVISVSLENGNQQGSQQPIPEPTTIALLSIGLMGLTVAGARRKWRKNC
ncbi:cell surface receptor IPT/TIG [Candidatus Scalindua japonica]|uniref:Cell surface receptor IPT/TIG n=1 Tax=Candidatus Scalindua japonica TaxID=1284222 RepID=A0A286TTG6_9BACT|nr:DVUA0089 family protein [Candidatus Scalindua japonica]GAX59177.1 cell surface receptor IPT/TIG [Candidatus Scalindua japonica]